MLAAAAVSAAMVATRGHVAPQSSSSAHRPVAAAVCLYQVPGSMSWVNLYALQRMDVRKRALNLVHPLYETVLTFGKFDSISIDIAPGVHVGIYTDAIIKRIAECKEG